MIELPGFLKRKPKAEQILDQEAAIQKVWQAVSHGKREEALGLVDKIISHDKANADAWMAKGSILEMLKRPSEAREAYEKAGALGNKAGAKRASDLRDAAGR